MSVKLMGMVWDRYPVGGGEMNLALKLADHAHDDGTHIFPGVPSLAKATRQTTRGVEKQLARMVACGWLIPVKNQRGGRGVSVEYRISPAWIKGEPCSGFSEQKDERGSGFRAVDNSLKTPNAEAKNPERGSQNPERRDSPYIREPSLTVIEPNTPLPPKGGEDLDSNFERIVAAYPRSTNAGVAKARGIWRTMAPNPDLVRVMLAAIERQSRSDEWQRNRGQFVPKLSRWLAEQRWLDTHDSGALRGGQALQGEGGTLPPEPPRTAEELAQNARRAAETRAQLGLPRKVRAAA
ncbi:hypothetical protein P3G55_18815 [Leptospira sp. 96542]|nr:hypothetical protein [Leptospira sp. 96542]